MLWSFLFDELDCALYVKILHKFLLAPELWRMWMRTLIVFQHGCSRIDGYQVNTLLVARSNQTGERKYD
jgi:hypothetical protein